MAIKLLISFLILGRICFISGTELVTANVTKVEEGTSVRLVNATVISPNEEKEESTTSVPPTSAPVTKPGSIKVAPSRQAIEDEEFKPPSVISIDAGEADSLGSFAMFPSNFPNLFGNDGGLEETFTYQVKKHKRKQNRLSIPLDFNDELNTLKGQIRSEAYDELRNYVNDLNHQLNSKIRNITEKFDEINSGVKRDVSGLGSTLHQLTSDVYNLTTLSKETTRSIRALQYAQELERTSFHTQIVNLTGQLEKLQTEKTNDLKRITETLSNIQAKMDNSSQELRMHEAYIRYGQQLTASLKNYLEKSDERISGLEKDGGPQWAEQTVGCGGVIVANSGIISYKFRQPYQDNERCVWIIRANRRAKINLQLIEDGFQNQSNSDFLTVTEFATGEEQHPVHLLTTSRLEHGNKVLHTFHGPVIFLTFYSDSTIPGTGFSLKFEGTGNRSDPASVNAVRYTHLHYSTAVGSFSYPKDADAEMTYQPNELVTVAISPMTSNSVKVHMTKSDLEKDEYCEFDSISFYGSVTGSYTLNKRYCHQNEEFNGEIIQSNDGIFLVVFRSDASTQSSGFRFTWET